MNFWEIWLLTMVAIFVAAWFLNTPEEKDKDREDFEKLFSPVRRLWQGLVHLWTGR